MILFFINMQQPSIEGRKSRLPDARQKFLTLTKGLVAPIQKAMMSVSEVMVMETAVDRMVLAIRSSILSRMLLCRQSVIS